MLQKSPVDQLMAQYPEMQVRPPTPAPRCGAHRHPDGPASLLSLTPEARAAFVCGGTLTSLGRDNCGREMWGSCGSCGAEHAPRPRANVQGLWPVDDALLPFGLAAGEQ